ncbi:ribonuclease P protein subunit p20 [Agelaius tricolor]|uniref:ribonuclease P protein subunit p20 n=1 Tax=Agelaius tricolor TaxID=9191 RepID=UPI0039F1E27E
MGWGGAPPVGPKKKPKTPQKTLPGARGGRGSMWAVLNMGVSAPMRGVAPGEAWPRSGSGGGAGRARMSSGRSAAPSPPPGALPGPPSRRRRRAPPTPGPAPPTPGSPPASAAAAAVPGSNDVFVTSRSDFRAQLRRCQRLLAPGGGPGGAPGELRLHGLGLAVPRTINLALQLQAGAGGALRLHASTSSVPLRDHRHRERHRERPDSADSGDGDGDNPRHNSAIHIRLCREAPCA